VTTLERRYLNAAGTLWQRTGRTDIGGSDSRASLVYGSYIPGWTANTTGYRTNDPISGALITRTTQNGTSGVFTPTVGATYTDVDFWCKVACSNTGGGGNTITFNNCRFFNQQPEAMYAASVSANGGSIQNFGSDPCHIVLLDCTFDAKAWFNSTDGVHTSAYWGHPVQVGFHGGNFTAQRCEFVNAQDGVNYVGPTGSLAIAQAASCLFEANWVHANFYLNGWTGPGSPSDAQTHSDCFQFNTGGNITIRYNMLGGRVDTVGYLATPGYNSGDDAHNSGIMIQQEVDTSAINHVGPVYIGYNWLGGGASTFNVFLKNSNTGSDWQIEYNKVMLRGTSAPGGSGYEIYSSIGIAVPYLGNVQWDPAGSISGTGVAAGIVTH